MSKLDDEHENNWWSLHVEKAASLVERCIKQYNWDRAETKSILNSYRQFLLLKKEKEDWDATKLSPCYPISQMWLQHSQMEDYDYDMRNLLGHVINRRRTLDASAELEGVDEKALVEAAKDALTARFGSYDKELWETIQFSLVDQLGEEKKCDVNKRAPLSKIFEQYADEWEENVEKFQFVFNEKVIDTGNKKSADDNKNVAAEATAISLGLKSNDKIEARHADCVGVIIRLLSEDKEEKYLVNKTAMISKTFDTFAEEVEKEEDSEDEEEEEEENPTAGDAALAAALAAEVNGAGAVGQAAANNNNPNQISNNDAIGGNEIPAPSKRSKYVFILQNKQRIFGYESAILLGLKPDGPNIIDVVPVERYKCANCICCNPPKSDQKATSKNDAMEQDGEEEDDSSDDDY